MAGSFGSTGTPNASTAKPLLKGAAMDKIRSDRERDEVSDLASDLIEMEMALGRLADLAEDQHELEIQKWANDTIVMLHIFVTETEARLEEYEERHDHPR